jgi:hypothetical protein
MRAKVIIPVASVLIMLVACNFSGVTKPARKMMIPEDKLVKIITDTYLTSGMLDAPEVRNTWGQRDSILNYIDVVEKYGYTYEQFDTTLHWYFIAKPKKMAKIYDKVTGNLLELEARIKSEGAKEIKAKKENLWTGKPTCNLPEDFARDPLWFDITVDTTGQYVLSADIIVYEDDQSLDPRVTVFFSTTDSLGVEVRDNWDEFRLKKNGQLQKVIIMKNLDKSGPVHIRGWLLNHSTQTGEWQKHAHITNISLRLTNKPGPQK